MSSRDLPPVAHVVAGEHESQVKLTKFASLNHRQSHHQLAVIPQPSRQAHCKVISGEEKENDKKTGRVIDEETTSAQGEGSLDLLRSSAPSLPPTPINGSTQSSTTNLTATNIISSQDEKNLIKMMAKYQRISFRRKESIKSAKGGHDDDTNQDFKIIWRNLSLQVDEGTYDRLINGMFSSIDRFFKFARGTNCSEEDEEVKQNGQNLATANNSGSQNRVIFSDLNGCVKSGEISAILGPSGSGKTSLLNAICGRADNYRGEIQLLGGGGGGASESGSKKRRMRLSIIPQRDYLIENLTVRENLLYSSKILNTNADFDHHQNILRVVNMLNLATCLDSSVMNISGGEYKRVSIGQELLKRPDILILDEPTSGLDSLNCKKLVQSLVQLIEASRRGEINRIAIIVTIHQPDIDVFNMFDHVYCMAKGGRVIYDGHPRDSMEALRSSGAFQQTKNIPAELTDDNQGPLYANPANLLIEIASEEVYGSEPIEQLARLQRKQFEQMIHEPTINGVDSPPNKTSEDDIDNNDTNKQHELHPIKTHLHLEMQHFEKQNNQQQHHSNTLSSVISNSSQGSSNYATSSSVARVTTKLKRDKRLNVKNDHTGHFWHHTNLLAKRAFVSTLRDPLMTVMSLMFHLTIPFVMWTVYSKRIGSVRVCPVLNREMDVISMAHNKTQAMLQGIQEELALSFECSTMFFLTTYAFSMCSLAVAALAFPLNMHILLKEVRNGWYNLPTFVLGKTLANTPFEIILPVVSLMMVYLMLDMPGSFVEWRLWAMALVVALMSMISHNLGLIFGTLCMDSVPTAIFLAVGTSLPLVLLSGFTARIKHMPVVLQKLSWLSPYRHSTDLMNIIRFGFGMCPCDETTDEYLRSKSPQFTDIPEQMKPLFGFYLANTANNQNDDLDTNSNSTDLLNSTATAINQTVDHILGVNYDLVLNASERKQIIGKFETNELDIFGQMANMVARSFSFGRQITGCQSVRSELLEAAGTAPDDYMNKMFACMFGLLIITKIILFIVVKFKIGSRL